MLRILPIMLACLVLLTAPAICDEGTADMSEPELTANINFIYLSCNDLDAMRHFYSDLLGLKEVSYREGSEGWLVYQCTGFQFMVFPSGHELPVIEGWGMQPGWEGGTVEGISWSVDVGAKRFAGIVRGLLDDGVDCFGDRPLWCQDSYWSFPVHDPMGNTVEVHYYDPELPRPASTEWSWD